MTVSDNERQLTFNYCSKHLPGAWKSVRPADVNISAVCGGMTNQLYRCSLNDNISTCADEPRQLLLRIYGPAKGDIQTDVEIFNHLASASLGPRLLGTFDEGRFEEYLPSDALRWDQMTDEAVARVMAHKIAAIHKLDIRSIDKKSNWLIDKYRQYEEFITNSRSSSKPLIFDEYIPESSRRKAKQLMETDFSLEIALLEQLFKRTQSAPLVFSHNDLHQNNVILLHDESLTLEERVILIDFEYSSYNYRTFDAANHLNEWCFDYNKGDYPFFHFSLDRFPSIAKQKQFLRDYLDEIHSQQDKHLDQIAQTNGNPSLSDMKINIENLFVEMQPCLMASNLLWTMWAIQSALTSRIKFGYWEMAQSKWDCYLLTKKQLELLSGCSTQINGD